MPGTVYILGAGASRAATMSQKTPAPLASEFFREDYLKEYWYDLEFDGPFKDSPLYFILSRYFSFGAKNSGPQGINHINIEEVYSFLHSFDRVFQSSSYKRDVFSTARKQLHKYLITVIRYTSWNSSNNGFLEKLVSKIKTGDSIVTFNWDTLIEQSLARSKRKSCKALLHQQFNSVDNNNAKSLSTWDDRYFRFHQGRFIKVHGSINYTHCTSEVCKRFQLPYIWELKEESPEHWSCIECGSPTDVMILAPHGAKTYSTSTFFKLQASLAAEKLSIASKIVIIGYSVPVFDIEARSMLRCARLDDEHSEAWLHDVVVVNPQVSNADYVSELKNLLGVDNHAAHGHEVTFRTYTDVAAYERAKDA